LMCVEIIVCNISVVFLRHGVVRNDQQPARDLSLAAFNEAYASDYRLILH